MLSLLLMTAQTPRKPPPSTKSEKFGSRGSSGDGGGGAGCCASAIPAARRIAAGRPIKYLTFIQISSGRVCALHAYSSGRFQKVSRRFSQVNANLICVHLRLRIMVYRLQSDRLVRMQFFVRCVPNPGGRLPPKRKGSDERRRRVETFRWLRPRQSRRPCQQARLLAPAVPETL